MPYVIALTCRNNEYAIACIDNNLFVSPRSILPRYTIFYAETSSKPKFDVLLANHRYHVVKNEVYIVGYDKMYMINQVYSILFNQIDDIRQQTIILTTYAEFTTFSAVKQVMLFDKHSLEGYYTKNKQEHKLSPIHSKTGETLPDIIRRESKLLMTYKNYITEFNLEIDIDIMLIDIVSKCISTDREMIEIVLKYNEYAIVDKNGESHIFDTKTRKTSKISCTLISSPRLNLNSHINEKTVDKIIAAALHEPFKLLVPTVYNRLARSVFVEKSQEPIILYDAGQKFMTIWLVNAIKLLLGEGYVWISNMDCDIPENTRLVVILDDTQKIRDIKYKYINVIVYCGDCVFYDHESVANMCSNRRYLPPLEKIERTLRLSDFSGLFSSNEYMLVDYLFWCISR